MHHIVDKVDHNTFVSKLVSVIEKIEKING